MKRAFLLGMLYSSACLSPYIFSATENASMLVSVNVLSACSITANDMQFGNYNPAEADAIRNTTSINATCTSGTSAIIKMDDGSTEGEGSSLGTPIRRMIGSEGEYLEYAIYSDNGYSAVWGGTAETGVAITGTGSVINLTAYGNVPALQSVSAGSYSDSIQIEINF